MRVDPRTNYLFVAGYVGGNAYVFGVDNGTLYIMEPALESVQVVRLSEDMLTGEFLGSITDPGMDGVASGSFFGNFLYVNNARYSAPLGSAQWITKLNIDVVE